MTSVNLQTFDSVSVRHDVEVEGSILAPHCIFLGRLCITDEQLGLKIYQLKDVVPTVLRHTYTQTFDAGDFHTCGDWFREAQRLGLCHSICELFPRQYMSDDFTEVSYDEKLNDLYAKHDALDSWLQTDTEAAQI